jgi:hypothetical protein
MSVKTARSGRRRSGRIKRELPIQVSGIDAMGRDFTVPTHTRMLSRYGAEILLRNELVPDQEISITLLGNAQDWDARVVGLFSKQPQGFAYGIEFLFQDGNFWGITFPPAVGSPEPRPKGNATDKSSAAKPLLDDDIDFEKLWQKKQGLSGTKHYAIRLKCPHSDAHGGPMGGDDQWLILQDRQETLAQILDSPWAFTCPIHGAQSSFPLEAKEAPPGVAVPLPGIGPKEFEGAHTGAKPGARASQSGPKVRRETRQPQSFRVWVRGLDANGHPFRQSAVSLDISRSGGRLDGIGLLTLPGTTIEVKRYWRKALFRIVWTGKRGTSQANQVGIVCLEPSKNVWGMSDTN